jgi:hypothetical protein
VNNNVRRFAANGRELTVSNFMVAASRRTIRWSRPRSGFASAALRALASVGKSAVNLVKLNRDECEQPNRDTSLGVDHRSFLSCARGQLNSRPLGRVTTSHKNMFKKQDEDFDEMAADSIRRRAKIADLSWRRTWIGCCAVVVTFATVAEMLSGEKGAIAGVLITAISFASLTKCESDLRLLRVIERLQKDKDEKTTA